jgi:hypothetical protein
MFGKMKLPSPEESVRGRTEGVCRALKWNCPWCSEQLSGHRYSEYAAASESNQELVTALITAFNACDWRALSEIKDINVLYDIWTVLLLECPKKGFLALLMLDYYEPLLSLQMVEWKRFNPPSGLELKLEWRNLQKGKGVRNMQRN